MSASLTNRVSSPLRRRWRWPKGLVLALGGWLAFLGGVRLLWSWEAERRLDAAVAASRASGLLLEVGDLAAGGLPDAENGAYWLVRAGGLLSRLAASAQRAARSAEAAYIDATELIGPARHGLALTDRERAYVAKRAGVYGLLRAARGCERHEWPVRVQSPLGVTPLPQLAELRELAQFSSFAAAASFADGDHARAVELIRDGLSAAEHARDRRLFLIGLLTAHGMDRAVLSVIEMIAGELRVAGSERAASSGAATRAQVEALIAALLDESALDAGWREAMRIEALQMRDTLRTVASGAASLVLAGGFVRLPTNRIFAPALLLEAARLQAPFDALAEARQDRALAANALDAATTYDESLSAVLSGASMVYFRDWTRAVLAEERGRCRRRMAACALAIRLYELDMGTRPAMLGELVPHYLPAVPIDLLDGWRGPLRYLPDADPPRLYSVGEDGVDDGGSRRARRGERRARDEVLLLDSRTLGVTRGPRAIVSSPTGLAELFPQAGLSPADAARLALEAPNDGAEEEDPEGEYE